MQWLKSPSAQLKLAAILVLALVAVGMGLGVHKMRDLNTHYSMSQFMPKDHPLYQSDRLVKKTFRINDREPVIVNLLLADGAKGTWLRKDRIDLLNRAGAELAGVENITKVLSLANVEMANDTKSGIQVDKLLTMVPEGEWKHRVLKDALLTPGLISKDGRKVTLIADIPLLSEAEMNVLMTSIRGRLGKLLEGSDATLMVSGVLPIQTEMTTLLSQELVNFFGLAFLVCVVTLLAYFRSLSTVFVCLVLVIIANIATFTSLAVLGIPFSVMSSALPIMCSIEALAIGSHTLLIFGDNYRQAMSQPNPPSKARIVWNSYRSLLFPNFLMSTTTIIGFATLISSQVPLIRQFSQSVSCGIMMSCICMQIALPSLMYLFPIPVARSWTGAKARWALWVIENRRLVVFATLGILTLTVLNGFRLNWSVQLYDDLPHVGDIKTSADLIDKELGGMIPLEVMISKTGEENPWYEPARMQELAKVLKRWRKDPAIGSAVGLPDLLNTGIQALDSRKAIAETLFLYGFSGADNPATHFLSTDGNATRLSFRMKDVKADEMGGVIDKIEADIKKNFPGFEVHTGGMARIAHPLNAELSADLIYGLWHSLLLITVLLVVVFRSFRLAFIAAVPNLLAPIALLVTMAYMKTPIKPVVAIIFSIALGLAYNNTIFLLTRLKKVQASFKGAADVIMRTWYQEGNPCLFSSASVLGGFAVFLASYFSPNRTFGAYMLWSIAVGIVGDLVVLPAILRMFPWFVFPGETDGGPRRKVSAHSWTRTALVLLAAMLAGLGGPKAAAAPAPAPKMVRTPFVLTMKKDEFAELINAQIIQQATAGKVAAPVADIVLSNPMDVRVSGITVNLDYDFNAPSNARTASEWEISSKRIAAELNVARVDAHLDTTVNCGSGTCNVHLDGSCTNVKLQLPEGSANASGKLVLTQRNGSPKLELRDFNARWTEGSWQVVSMTCTGPQGFDQAVANAARQQLLRVDPELNQRLARDIQAKIDDGVNDFDRKDITFGNPFQTSQVTRLTNIVATTSATGDTTARGDAIFYFQASKPGCGAEMREFAAPPAVRAGETALFIPYEAMKQLLACAHADGSFFKDTDSSSFPGFTDLMHSTLKKNVVWPDLNNFPEDAVMKFHGETAAVPVLSGEKSLGSHVFTANLQQKLYVVMYAPKDGRYVPYVTVNGFFTGPVRISLANGVVSMKTDSTGQLALNGRFHPTYVEKYHPEGEIDWTRLTPEAQKALQNQGWTMELPVQAVTTRTLLKTTDGDLMGSNFRIGFKIERR